MRPPQGALRYEAEWVTRQYQDANGEWDVERDEFAGSFHSTREAAEAAAIKSSKAAGQVEWILVAEQRYLGYHWVDQRRWTGDWSGLDEVAV